MIGIVKGYEITYNRNSDHKVVMLQVQLSDTEDIQSVELYNPFGEKSIPENNQRVLVLQLSKTWKVGIAIDDKIAPSDLNDGEKKIYSLDPSGVIAAFITFCNTGELFLNGDTDYAVKFNALVTALNTFAGAVNTALGTKLDGGGTPGALTIDISSAKNENVRM